MKTGAGTRTHVLALNQHPLRCDSCDNYHRYYHKHMHYHHEHPGAGRPTISEMRIQTCELIKSRDEPLREVLQGDGPVFF